MRDSPTDRALVTLVSERGPALVRYAHLYTGDAAEAQDLVQDALVKVFVRTRSGFEPDVLEAYVRTTIARTFIDEHRRRRTFREVRHLVAVDEHAPGPEGSTAARLDLRAALDRLSRQERAVVVLRFFEDLSTADTAAAMGLAEGTVKRYLSNAVGRLERELGPMPSLRDEDTLGVTLHANGRI